jgi:uncharacterized protein YycO
LQRGTGFAMALVRIGTLSRWGHACIAAGDSKDGYIQIVEAMPEGVRTRTSRVDEWVWSNIPLTDDQRDAIAAGAMKDLGKGYDWPAIGMFIARWFGAKITRGSKDHPDNNEMCSEAVDWHYRDDAAIDLKPGYAPNTVSPGDLAQYLVEH